jgi:hypothetical protein
MLGVVVSTWVAATLTIAIFSFLYRDNPFYRFAEHLYVGVSAAFGVVIFWYQDVWPLLVGNFRDYMAAGNRIEAWILIFPAILGLLMWTRFFPKIGWISRWPLGFTIGIGAGLGITGGIQGFILPQLKATMLPLGNPVGPLTFGHGILFVVVVSGLAFALGFRRLSQMSSGWKSFLSILVGMALFILLFPVLKVPWLVKGWSAIAADNLIIVVGVVTTLLYFYFSREHTGLLGTGSRVGIVAIMISFGASFGYTVMARVSLLIGRCYFLINEWIMHGIIGPLKALFRI